MKSAVLCLNIDPVSHPARSRGVGLGKYTHTFYHVTSGNLKHLCMTSGQSVDLNLIVRWGSNWFVSFNTTVIDAPSSELSRPHPYSDD